MRKAALAACLAAAAIAFSLPAAAEDKTPPYLSLRPKEANMRSGPGYRYPTAWVYRRPGLPFKVLAEFEGWYKVEDSEGAKGWFHQSMVSRRRTARAMSPHTVRKAPGEDSAPLARVAAGAVGRIERCRADADWCRVRWPGGYEGWSPRSALFGLAAGETVD
ncbi:hypothetical protein FACS1894186_2810 [Alphaproteobacteria bacterium]|nr:hypothetical protein FACS1894186_2810 [Alphaproteobacteria bacterium]